MVRLVSSLRADFLPIAGRSGNIHGFASVYLLLPLFAQFISRATDSLSVYKPSLGFCSSFRVISEDRARAARL